MARPLIQSSTNPRWPTRPGPSLAALVTLLAFGEVLPACAPAEPTEEVGTDRQAALNPNALNPNALNPNALNPNALNPNALNPNALSPEALRAISDPGDAG